ncbi:MAG: hypothetical protein Q4F72_11755, partial [Desulfovibrionaceae bacterium]|nr:hypothetical protein [Desulfovibrionaceae bacterium]
MISPDEFWWKNVTGPRTFLRRAAETLADGRIPILELPLELPWRHSMRAAALECLQDLVLDEPHFEIYDAADECGDQDIGEFLLERLASRDLASGYRAMSGLSVQQYLERH